MPNAKDYLPFYDYSLIETGLQTYYVTKGEGFVKPPDDSDPDREAWVPPGGQIAVFTAFQNLVFQKPRWRLAINLRGIAPASYQAQAIVDPNGQIRATLYKATLDIFIVTDANYIKHTQLRAYTEAMAEEIAPMTRQGLSSTIGVNQYLTNHLVTRVESGGQDTTITPQEGVYTSGLTYPITFAWRRDQLPS